VDRYVVEEHGTLEDFLSARYPSLSLGTLRRAMVQGCVCVDGTARQRKWRLRPGDVVTFELKNVLKMEIPPEEHPLDVLWEDDFAIVVTKPADIGTIPDTRNNDTVLLSGVYHIIGTRPFVVHRLDRGTSGAIILAKSPRSAKFLMLQFEGRTVEKEYLAVVDGTPDASGEVDARIGRVFGGEPRFQAVEDGLPARTGYAVEEDLGGFSLVRARPFTGRTHQIRIHMAHIGHPLAVDPLYGKRDVLRESDIREGGGGNVVMDRLTLHAERIVFDSPSGEKADVRSPLPEDFARVLEALRAAHNC
jgi:23S rRNA pseudouridine1911/1915/1917 synthase